AIGGGAVVCLVDNTVLAYADGATVDAAASVHLRADETTTIYGLAIGGAVAVSGNTSVGGGGTGVGAAGAGVGNTVTNTVQAYIRGSTVNAGTSGDVTVSATDTSTITANGGGVGVGIGARDLAGSGTGGSLGVAIAINDIENDVEAFVD